MPEEMPRVRFARTEETDAALVDDDADGDPSHTRHPRKRVSPRRARTQSFSFTPQTRSAKELGLRLLSRRNKYSGKYNIKFRGHKPCDRFCEDPFHDLVEMSIFKICGVILVSHFFFWAAYAPLYLILSDRCQLACETWMDALYYSMITMTTIGFGTDSMVFNQCSGSFFVIGSQFVIGSILNAVFLGLLFTRLSRSTTRASSIKYSEQAVIRSIRGKLYFMFQIVDERIFSLSESHVKCYLIRHSTDPTEPFLFQQNFMRLAHPDDQVGGYLFMSLPTLVCHALDAWSPLVPERPEHEAYMCMSNYEFPDVLCRHEEADQGNRAASKCEVCGEAYGAAEDLKLHMLSMALECKRHRACARSYITMSKEQGGLGHSDESAFKKPTSVDDTESSSDDGEPPQRASTPPIGGDESDDSDMSDGAKEAKNWVDELYKTTEVNRPDLQAIERGRDKGSIKQFLEDCCAEILVIVEGVDPYTSSTVQSRHSYCMQHGEIVFDHEYVPCVGHDQEGNAVIDMDKFHTTRPVGDVFRAKSLSAMS